jgi:membrane protease subunit (stomatin/prohibitin family)
MFMRRRPLLRAAAVGGGAYMAGKHMARQQDDQSAADTDQDQRISDLESQQQQPQQQPAPAAAAPASSATIDQLKQLSELHQQGVLTDAEFTAAKSKLLGT